MNDFIVLDIETTGLSPKTAEITEVGALKVCGKTFEVLEEFSSLVDIDGPVPYFITKLTGITRDLLDREGIDLHSVLKELHRFVGDLDIYAHNSSFDERFIKHYWEVCSIECKTNPWMDTIKVFKQKFPGRKTYKLESLIRDFGLANKEDHRAISDAKHTLELLRRCR